MSIHACSKVLVASSLVLAAACGKPEQSAPAQEPTAVDPPPAAPAPEPEPPAPAGGEGLASEQIKAETGEVSLTPIQHASMILTVGGKNIFVDPWSKGPLPDAPKADMILITDNHFDHLDLPGVEKVKQEGTTIVGPKVVAEKLPQTVVINNGETKEVLGISIQAVPMYNLKRGPEEGKLFHDKGRGNGYILTLEGSRFYISGDTECIDEMKGLENIDVAFVCMNLPYTMPPEEAAECVKAFQPKVVYPYHYGESDLEVFKQALADQSGVEVRLRTWYH